MMRHKADIENKNWYLEYDHETFDVRFIKKEESLEGRIAELIAINFKVLFFGEMTKLSDPNKPPIMNYVSMKSILADKIDQVAGMSEMELLTWCRGRLYLDESFAALNLNFSSSPSKVLCFSLTDVQGKKITLDYKNTHIHYVPKFSIFVLLVPEGQQADKRLAIRVIDIKRVSLSNQKLKVIPTPLFIESRVWYSSCFDYKENILYVIGGLDNTGFTSPRILNIRIIGWDGNQTLQINEQPPIQYEALQVSSAVPCYFMTDKYGPSLAVIGGVAASVALRFETFNFKAQASEFDM
jgi:hypothetical protein